MIPQSISEIDQLSRQLEIEAALEKVRGRANSMQHSDQLKEVIQEVFDQLQRLGLNPNMCCIDIFAKRSRDINLWVATPTSDYPEKIVMPYFDHPIFNAYHKARKSKRSLFAANFSKKLKNSFFDHTFRHTDLKKASKERKEFVLDSKTYTQSTAFTRKLSVWMVNYQGQVYSKEENQILLKFTRVFDQCYTRFLDIKRAEEQAREAQIEVALERVRARSLAMRNSYELQELINEVFTQFKNLGLSPMVCVIDIFKKGSKDINMWAATAKDDYPELVVIPYIDNPIFNEYDKAKKKRKTLFLDDHPKEIKDAFFKHAFDHSDLRVAPKQRQHLILDSTGFTRSTSFTKHAGITMINYDRIPFSDKENDILVRVAKVFDQSYTRFLDLKKAEEQARKAQIEAALEKVRSRMLAMQKSSELEGTTRVMHQQLDALGVVPDGSGVYIAIIDQDTESAVQWIVTDDSLIMPPGEKRTPLTEHPLLIKTYDGWKRKDPLLIRDLSGKELQEFLSYFQSLPSWKDKEFDTAQLSDRLIWSEASFSQGTLGLIHQTPLGEEALSILVRFSKVFDLTYTRFLDLKKAEEQAREAQIEASLERVRAKAMAMHSSEDLTETVGQLFKELNALDISLLRCGVGRIHKDTRVVELFTFTGTKKGEPVPVVGKAVLTGHPVLDGCFEHWKKQKEYHPVLKGVLLKKYYQAIKADFKLPGKQDSQVQYGYFFSFAVGVLYTYTETRFSEEELVIFRKFSSVMGLTYRRFLDLKEAEEQAREAQIEVALERVRARTMAMHKGDELADTSLLLFEQITELGIQPRSCGFLIMDEGSKSMQDWSTILNDKGKASLVTGTLAFDQHQLISEVVATWRKAKPYFIGEIHGKELQQYYRAVTSKESTSKAIQDKVLSKNVSEWTSSFYFEYGMMYVLTPDAISEDQINILLRFARVFKLTYRRFLDLKKAEEQTREAQIEAALERVRAAAMAMHSSDDIFSVAEVLHDQLGSLGQKEFEASIIHIYPEQRPDFDVWYSYRSTEGKSVQVTNRTRIPENACSWSRKVVDLYRSDDNTYLIKSSGRMLRDWYQVMADGVAPDVVEYDRKGNLKIPKVLYYHFSKFSGGALLMVSNDPPAEEARDMQRRAATVFDLAYRRFLDLQKAENQARESQIEAALERVRASTMAMHTSDDVVRATSVLFRELVNLGIETLRCGIVIINDNQTMELWGTSTASGDITFNLIGTVDMTIHPLLRQFFKDWKSGKKIFSYELKGKDAERYYKAVQKLPEYGLQKVDKLTDSHFSTGFLFKEGALFAFTKDPFTEESTTIFQKFTNVFILTYRRYLDLKEAEARASAAVLESSLDRVRAEIASMRTTEDLQRITPLVWRELRSLGVPFFRCGVFIMDESAEMVHMYLSKPTGESLAAVHLDFDDKEIPLVQDAIDHWKSQTVHRTHWDRQQFKTFTQSLKKRGLISSLKTYQQGEKPPESLNLHQVPFKQGMLYVGSSESLPDNQIELVQSLADAFSVAYSRYEDFVQLEEAKESVENTLIELKSAQDQLIHSEKMASLGELTAGIAHEIQNPLNFVNNFSEVSGELLDEIREEIDAGDPEEVAELIEDLIQNLDKISHHGKRASGIVKGMLDHSRASSDVKVATDINVLADEYLRLAYHGFRAKDKSFNANFKADLGDDLPKINIVSQDIGRVILNLVNNAFQAVREVENPEVIVKTQMKDGSVVISVIDNGPGIPEDIKEKIFQPFFTTKAAGEGTGLGLSLSYDIVTKGHGGEIIVNSNVGLGTEFVIYLHC